MFGWDKEVMGTENNDLLGCLYDNKHQSLVLLKSHLSVNVFRNWTHEALGPYMLSFLKVKSFKWMTKMPPGPKF